ncbi:MAG: NUDIX domain-containing protein [Bacteroidales bacterium]|nr:NUDIX domain-containing protein [Bacteroidales bacterium]
MLPVVEPTGTVIGRASRNSCHSGTKLLHPVVHLHIIDRFGQIYLQRRSATKTLLPLYWDTAVGGHITYGEYLREALFREAGEELGFYDFNPVLLATYLYESPTEKELVNTFGTVGNFELKPDGEEVCEGRWWPISELENAFGKGILTPNFEYEFPKIKQALLALL